ncbi:hypothetical protein [Salinispora mooreana]|uniref:hypothetical protein n=1 Tax=Salinispora mooreana TaxID=999545 RepID=UPI00037340F3|nr:hypothetical protein [Salinispora mooreana]
MIGAKIGAGREADVHTWCDDAVIKLYRPGLLWHRAEARALATLAGHGIAPKLADTVEWDGRVGLVLARRLITSSRSVFTRRYARAYRAGSTQPLPQSGPWLAVQAAARLAEGIAGERATLIALLERLFHQTKR